MSEFDNLVRLVTRPTRNGPAPVTGQLLDSVTAFIRRYVVLASDAQATAIALWVLHTWALDGAHATPYLVVVSPEKRAGKTRLLEVLDCSSASRGGLRQRARRRCPARSQTTARRCCSTRSTRFLGRTRNAPSRWGAIISSGNRPGAAVARCIGEGSKQIVEDSNVYCPKVLAGIDTGRLPDTIRDRGVEVRMERKTAGEHVERFRVRFAEKATEALRADLEAWGEVHAKTLLAAVPDLPEALDDRAGESWEALFDIADLAGGDWPGAARAAAVSLAGGDRDDAPASAKALAAVQVPFKNHDVRSTADLLKGLSDKDELPFCGWNDGDGLKARDLAKLLKRYRIKPRSVRLPGEQSTRKGYLREQFSEAWARYLPPTSKDAAQTGTAARSSPHGNGDVPDVPLVPDISGKGASERNGRDPDAELDRVQDKFPDLFGGAY